MKNRLIYLIGIILHIQSFAVAQEILPSTPLPAHIIVIDHKHIIDSCLAMSNVKAQMEIIRQQHVEELTNDEQQLRQDQEELNVTHQTLSADALTKREKLFKKNVDRIQKKADLRKKQFNDVYRIAIEKIRTQYHQCLRTYIRDHKVDLVLDSQSIVYALSHFEKTQEILDQLNLALPQLKVILPNESKIGNKDDR